MTILRFHPHASSFVPVSVSTPQEKKTLAKKGIESPKSAVGE